MFRSRQVTEQPDTPWRRRARHVLLMAEVAVAIIVGVLLVLAFVWVLLFGTSGPAVDANAQFG